MSILVRFEKHKAILRGASWRSAHAPLEEILNSFTRDWVQRHATSEELNGDLERAIAEAAAHRFEGRIGLHVPSARRGNQERYQNLRQFELFDFRRF